jgi:hypothetical protein
MLGDEKYMVGLNKNKTAVKLNLNKYKEIISPTIQYTNALTHEPETPEQAMQMPAMGYKILRLNNH